MSLPAIRDASNRHQGLVLTLASGIGVGFAITLTILCLQHVWLFDRNGHPDVVDFVVYWSTGRLVDHGQALAAYDSQIQHAMQVATVGHNFKTPLPWVYPPLFFFVVAALALLPLAPAFVVWNCASLLLHSGLIGTIAKRRVAFFAASAAPWTMLDMIGGQNGLLTSAIVAAVLLTLERRPVVSGILLGLLSYKPQFGVLFPFVLLFGGHSRAFASAALAVLFWTALSCVVFGAGSIVGFLHSADAVAHSHLLTNHGGAWSGGYQSIYGFARWIGASDVLSWMLQLVTSATCALALVALWRSGANFALKAAAFAACVPLATPYVFIYDLPILTVAAAFLYRHRPFDRIESWTFSAALLSAAAFPVHPYPAGFFASGALAALALRRASPELEEYLGRLSLPTFLALNRS